MVDIEITTENVENMAINKAKIDPTFSEKMEQHSKDIGLAVQFDDETIRKMSDDQIPKILLAILKELQDLGNRVLKLEQANNAPVEVKN